MPKRRRNPYFRRIMVRYDGSAQADKAVEVAFSFAQSTDCKVLLLAVVCVPKPATIVEVHAVLDEAREGFEKRFTQISRAAEELDVELETAVVVGHPVDQILRRTETDHMDLIILGHRVRSWFARIVLETFSEKLLRHARCPVMLVQ
jgi:nucleotide-binding universal stress UspA family protein